MRKLRLPMLLVIVLAFVAVQLNLHRHFFWPFAYLVTFAHECGHSLMTLLTGGTLHGFTVNPGGGGFARSSGGIRVLVISGGCLGSAAFGAGLIALNRFPEARKSLMTWTGLGILGMTLVYGSGLFTYGFGLAAGTAFLLTGLYTWEWVQVLLTTTIGLQVWVDSLHGMYRLFRVSVGLQPWRAPAGIGHGFSDADLMFHQTWIPAPVWPIVWSLIACWLLWLALRMAACEDAPTLDDL